MSNVTISVSASLLHPADYFVGSLYQVNSDGSQTLLQSIAPTKSGSFPYYTTPFQITFTYGLVAGNVYNIIVWENTVNTGPGGINVVSGNFTASVNNINIRFNQHLFGGISTQFTSTSQIVDSSMIGWDIWIENKGNGTMTPAVEYTYDKTTGTINFLLQAIAYNQEIIIHFYPQLSNSAPPPSLITSGVVITGNTTLTSTMKNQALYLQGASAFFTTILPSLASVADYDVFYFFSAGGSHINVAITCAGSDKVQRNVQVTQIILGQNERLKLFKANGVWNVDGDLPGVDNVGHFVSSYASSLVNTTPFDGLTRSRTTYARLWAWVLANCSPISDSAFNNVDANNNYINQGFFTSGDGSTTFRMPKLTNYFLRPTANAAGTFAAQIVPKHNHHNGIADDKAAGDSQNVFVYGQDTQDLPGLAKGNVGNTGGGVVYQGLTESVGTNDGRPNNVSYYLLCKI